MAKKVSYSFEFFPPNSPEGIKNLADTRQQLSAFKPEFYSVTFGAVAQHAIGLLRQY